MNHICGNLILGIITLLAMGVLIYRLQMTKDDMDEQMSNANVNRLNIIISHL